MSKYDPHKLHMQQLRESQAAAYRLLGFSETEIGIMCSDEKTLAEVDKRRNGCHVDPVALLESTRQR